MKRILLTSTALVAIAGAAAADISFSGEAEFSYNDATGFGSAVEMTAAGSAALDNGMTASASLTLEDANTVSAGDISLSSDTASITYHVGMDGTGAAYIGDELDVQGTLANIFEDSDSIVEDAGITASASLGGATISMSINAANAYQIGVSTDLGGTDLSLGFIEATGDFGAQMAGSASAVDYTLAFGSNDTYGLSASTTAGGADLSLDFGDAGWEIGASMAMGPATVGVTMDDTSAWEVSLDTSLEGVDLGFTFDDASAWTMTAGVTAGDVTVDFETDSASAWSLDATYDMGNGVTAGIGTDSASEQYVEVDYDLGGGANLSLDYATSADINPAEEITAGTTVSVSFSF